MLCAPYHHVHIHRPYLRNLPPFELWAIDSEGEDVEGPISVEVTHGSTEDTQRMGFRYVGQADTGILCLPQAVHGTWV